MTTRADAVATSLVDPGEEVLWSGLPDATMLWASRAWPITVLAGCFLSLSITGRLFGGADVFDRSGFAMATQSMAPALFALGAVFTAWTLWHWVRANATTYVLTTKRALVISRLPRRSIETIPGDKITFLATRDRGGGAADVLFTAMRSGPADNPWLIRPEGFHGLVDPDVVKTLIRREFLLPRARRRAAADARPSLPIAAE